IADQEKYNKILVGLSEKFKVPLVATQDSHYAHKDDQKAHQTLLAVQTGTDVGDSGLFSESEDFSFITPDAVKANFKEHPEAVENTLKIAEACNIEIEIGKFVFPEFKLEPGITADDRLRELAFKGIEKRGLTGKPGVVERLEYELGIIKFKGYAAYFLVVEDLIRFAHENGIYTNIRGSVAGSITTYLLGITSVDPLVYNIPFERFLNPERPSAPDIDMDFADDRREAVIDYAKDKYGEDKVAQIGTFGTMMARGAVRDVARALGHPYEIGDQISKLIPMGSQGFPMTIEHALELTPELKEKYENDPKTKEIVDLAKKLEGCVRHVSVHAAGVVISPKPLNEYTPIQLDPKGGKIITQYDMYNVGEDGIGLTKFDFLGIRNLTILANAVDLIKKYDQTDIDIEKIPLDDKKTFAMLARGETIGLFQLNGAGMTKALVELIPSTIHDINLMVALYRPGPIDNIKEYTLRKKGKKPVIYPHPKMKEFLEPTYGVLVYQDDLLMTAIHVAGYAWGAVDKFRKAIGKKIPEEMAKQHVIFVDGCVKNSGMTKEAAEELWNLFEPFQGYGFNKAHAASYGHVAYQTAYLKANYPSEYMAAVLSTEAGDVEKAAEIIAECNRMKIPVLPPDINESFGNFIVLQGDKTKIDQKQNSQQISISGDKIRFGLYAIKNLGQEISDAIIDEREKRGKYKSLADFLERITHKNLNKKSLESLIMAGAMDSLGERGQMLANMDDLLEFNREFAKIRTSQISLFGDMADQKSLPSLSLKKSKESSMTEKLAWEKELLGLYVSGHPLDKFKDKFQKEENTIRYARAQSEGSRVFIAGVITEAKTISTKAGQPMAFIKVADFTDTIELVVFPRILSDNRDLVAADKCVAIRGNISKRNDSTSIIVEAVKELEV
ncbi:MAG: DNA polymerase III subunit alpha, partial [Candidatus Paceibacterota bacterium]